MPLADALARLPAIDPENGRTDLFLGAVAICAGPEVIRFEIEIASASGAARELVARTVDPVPGDRDRFFGNPQQAEALRCRILAFAESELQLPLALAWGDALNQSDERFLFALSLR